MRNCILIISFLFAGFSSTGQLVVNTQFPVSGLVQKGQLWNIVVTNVTQNNLNLYISMNVQEVQTGDQILNASSAPFLLPPGTMALNDAKLMPVQYHQTGAAWGAGNLEQTGLLPPGNFLVCYSFFSDEIPFKTECFPIVVQALSPPQLILPEDNASITDIDQVIFSWTAPTPSGLFYDLSYNLTVVEKSEIQSPSDAIQMNIPIIRQENITGLSFHYPLSAPELQPGTEYVWQVIAVNGAMPAGSSESRVFKVGDSTGYTSGAKNASYTWLAKGSESSYAICTGSLKFAYINETADTSWDISIFDISTPQREKVIFNIDSIPLKRGLNLVESDLKKNKQFVDNHIFLLELRNSRKEVWRMKFEYIGLKN